MDLPDLTKYDEAQLRQILTRIDRERFPERVALIEARLSELAEDESASSSKYGLHNLSRLSVKPYPGAANKVFRPAVPFFVTGTIAMATPFVIESTAYQPMLALAAPVAVISILAALGITYFRLSTLTCPTCQNGCKKTILANRNWGAICSQCETQWDTGIGSDD